MQKLRRVFRCVFRSKCCAVYNGHDFCSVAATERSDDSGGTREFGRHLVQQQRKVQRRAIRKADRRGPGALQR